MAGLPFQVRPSTSIASVRSVGHIDVADELQKLIQQKLIQQKLIQQKPTPAGAGTKKEPAR